MALICHCRGVREATIVDAIRNGATTVEAIREACGASSECGGCEPAVEAVLEHALVGAGASRVSLRAG